jgi:phosphotransferase system  glucose/maltose/N-acetylglucosamine-specific IIC component
MMSWREGLLYVMSAVAGCIGLLLMGTYAWSVWSVIGEPDQSIIFWYSSFLLFGLFLVAVAVVFVVLARIMRRENRENSERKQ